MHWKQQWRPIFLLMGGVALLGVNQASAKSDFANAVASYCSSNGYTVKSEFQGMDCDAACHQNPTGKSAYSNGDYEYFCPSTVLTCTDSDNDGYYAEGGNCGIADFNDNNPTAYPGAIEICNDNIDNDGNGLVDSNDPNAVGCSTSTACTDLDGDGFNIDGGTCGPIDCNDSNSLVNPAAVEACGDGIDNNCNGRIDTADLNAVGCATNCTDLDSDGYSIEGGSCGPIDCDDNNSAINPAALEVCDDNVDNNCNNRIDSSDGVCQDPQSGGFHWWRPGTNGGGGNGGSHPFGWSNPERQHPDYVDDNGVSECLSCHTIDTADRNSSMSCYSCHGKEWEDPDNGDDNNSDSHPFGWSNPERQHPDYVDENGVSDCLSCHTIDTADRNSSMSCYSCHGKEWENPGNSSGDSEEDSDDDEEDESSKKRKKSSDD
jgi:hypothetical protein